MYIKSYFDLDSHPKGEKVKRALNRHIAKKGAKFCVYLPSHILDTASFMNSFQKSQMIDASHALSKYSPFESGLLFRAIDAGYDPEKLGRVSDSIRNANRLTARFIASEIERLERESPVITAIKNIFQTNKVKPS